MRLKINKSVSKLVGIWTFLLILIFKGIFPQSAYAFVSSLDACAVEPECAAAVGSELAPTIAAPTAKAAGTTAISTTTATGATTSSVEAVAGTTIVGDMRLSGVAAFYIWNRAQNEQAQNKARVKYCTANRGDRVCGERIVVNLYSTNNEGWYNFQIAGSVPADDLSTFADYRIIDQGQYQTFRYYVQVLKTSGWYSLFNVDPKTVTETPINSIPWKDWPQEKRNAAVQLLNNSDWQGLINSMPAGGILNPGDKVNAPTIVIPGQETDDPNTPADERLLKKEHGFFTFPGNPDFDKDGIPDATDLDNDNDGIVNTNDPEPYNPNVPFASSSPDQSGAVTSEVIQEIHEIASSHQNLECVECANEIETYLKKQGIHGRRLKLDTPRQTRYDGYIYDDSLPTGSDAISENGHHEGIAIRINGEEKVFDNHHPDGVPTEQWMNNLTFDSKERLGAIFRQSGYLF